VYLFGGQFQFTITQTSGKLYVQYGSFGEQPQELLAESDTRFFIMSHPFLIDFQKEADESIKKAKARNGPEELDGEKISEAPRRSAPSASAANASDFVQLEISLINPETEEGIPLFR
jgi:hypothetical protein